MKFFKLSIVVIVLLATSFFIAADINAQFWGQIAPPELSVNNICPSGYEGISSTESGSSSTGIGAVTICQRRQTCDQYGNGWPTIGVDTEVDARIIFCGSSVVNNVSTTLTANPSSINPGETSILTWTSSGATSCVGSGFLTNGAISGSVTVSPSLLTNYSVTCAGTSGSSISHAEVAVSGGIDLVVSKPQLNSGSLNGAGNEITFKSLVTNTGSGDVQSSIPSMFELDINNDGSYDLTLTTASLNGLNGGESKQINSSEWTTVLGTHAVRAVVDGGQITSVTEDSNGCYTIEPEAWSEQIGTEGCSTSGGPNACGLSFDPQSYYATIGGTPESISSTMICPQTIECLDSAVGHEMNQNPYQDGGFLCGVTNTITNGCTSVFTGPGYLLENVGFDLCFGGIGSTVNQGKVIFKGKQKDYIARYGSILKLDMQTKGGISIGNAAVYTGKKAGGGSSTLDYMCKLIDPESRATDYKARKYNSPGNNSIFLWNGRSWEKHGAKRYNSHVSGPFTCTSYPPKEEKVVSSGDFTETNEVNNYSLDYVFTVTQPQCSDGIDNDGDGDTDYPSDSDCSGGGDSTEGTPISTKSQCSDGIDNDGDGLTDLLDEGCSDATDNNESGNGPTPQVEISASTTLVRTGTEVIISWTASNVVSCTVSGPSLSKLYSTETVNDQEEAEIDSSSTYTITCATDSGVISDSVTVGIVPSFIEE